MIMWLILILGSIGIGVLCAFKYSGYFGAIGSIALPWICFLCWLLINEYVLPYSGGGASMWPIALLVGGTVAAFVGGVSYFVTGLVREGRAT